MENIGVVGGYSLIIGSFSGAFDNSSRVESMVRV
jgi:hypothetical protein